MKQKRLVSMVGALVVILGAVVLITGCPQANDAKDDTGFEVKPTGKADPALKGTNWSGEGSSMNFAEDGNIANISGDQALYTVEGEKINFDLSSQISNFQNMTEEKLIQESKINMRKEIAELEKEIKEAEKKGDEQKKKELKARLEESKAWLNALENPDAKVKEEMKQSVKFLHEYAGKMKAYAKFDGIFNSEKTQLTIEKFPHYDWETKEVIVKKIIFEKR